MIFDGFLLQCMLMYRDTLTTYPFVSIIIASLNSSRTLPQVLRSVRKQTYPARRMEVLVVDGGSTDNTRAIARSYGCQVIDNIKILPKWAKYIGFRVARGRYALYLDSDEVIESPRSLERKIALLAGNASVHAVTGDGYKNPRRYFFLNQYINEFGDPFSFFYYRLSKDHRYFIDTMKRRYRSVAETKDHIIFDFSNCRDLPLFELGAMGGMVDLNFLKAYAPEIMNNPTLVAHFINILVSRGALVAITKHDSLVHYSSDTFKKYLGKITSRVVNNVYTPAKEGFTGRNEFSSPSLRYKKYLFLPYALSLIGPLFDSLYLSITRRHFGYLIHVPLSFYTACLILFHTFIKFIGFRPIIKSYGEAIPLE